jgi:hypothetical protein
MTAAYSQQQGFTYDRVVLLRNDQAVRDRFTEFTRFDQQPANLEKWFWSENILSLPGSALLCLIDVMHSGCVERCCTSMSHGCPL